MSSVDESDKSCYAETNSDGGKNMRHGFNRRVYPGILLFLFLVFLSAQGPADDAQGGFSVRRIGNIIPFTQNAFEVDAPENGLLTIEIRNDTYIFRTLVQLVRKGTNRIEWDGCGYNQERLTYISYHIRCELSGESGKTYTQTFDSPVEYSGQALQFALASSERVSSASPGDWFVELKTIQDGTVCFDFYEENGNEPVFSVKRTVMTGRITRMTFRQITGSRQVEPGQYRIRVYETSNPSYYSEFSLNVSGEAAEKPDIFITGDIMPDSESSDEEIWNLMIQPSVVVDIGYTDHQRVYAGTDAESGIIGTFHGQTQALEVLEIRDDWVKVSAWNHESGAKIVGWVLRKKLKVEYPSVRYGILIDKKNQTLSVFEGGKRIETLMVSTGRMEKGALYQETAAGSFLTGLHRVDYSTNGDRYDFVIQYDGGNLIHQIPYRHGNGKKLFSDGQAYLGAKASHACIRVQSEAGKEAGLNAYWLWTHIPYHTRVIIMDDPEQRAAEMAILDGSAVHQTMPEVRSDLFDQADLRTDDQILLTFGGDSVLGGRESYFRRQDSLTAYLNQHGFGYPYSQLQSLFASDDLTCVNLECVLKDDGSGEDTKKQWRFRGLTTYAAILSEGSVELVNLANNHTIDYGEQGFDSTVHALEGYAEWCGPEHPTAVMIKGHMFGFAGCRETMYLNDPGVIERDIRQLREQGCEYIVYQCHWGTEYQKNHNALQEAMAKNCIRNGADLVIGHHPHIVQGIEYYQGKPIIYSLGNLVFGGTISLSDYDAMLVQVLVSFGEGEKQTEIRPVPILTSSEASDKINNYCPVIAEGEQYEAIMNRIQSDSILP